MARGCARSRLVSLVFTTSIALLGCGDDEEKDTTNGRVDAGASQGDAATAATREFVGTLVSILSADDSIPITVPHLVKLFDSDTGEELSPKVEGMTGSNGKITLEFPASVNIGIHIVGAGPAADDTSTYDSLILNVNPDSGDNLLRISNVGLRDVSASTTGVPGAADRAAVSGAVYFTPGGTARKGAVGCAKLYLDGKTVQDEDSTQTYVGASGLPVAASGLTQTLKGSGRFYFGNMETGMHQLKVSMDDGATFIATSDFFVPYTRAQAEGPAKAIIYQLGIDVDAAANPTPSDCPDKE